MHPSYWKQVESVFARAVDLALDERPAFVRAACGDDAALYEDVMGLLASDEGARASLRGVVRLRSRRRP